MSYTRRFASLTLVTLLAVAGARGLGAQVEEQGRTTPPADEIVERILAVVGDSVILMTQIDEQIMRLRAQGATLPTDVEGLDQVRGELLDQLVNELLVVQEAIRDTLIVVEDAEVEERVTEDLAQRVRAFGGQSALQQALSAQGMTMAAYREMLKTQVRRSLLRDQYLQRRSQRLSSIIVPEEEVRAFFDAQSGTMGQRPPTVTFAQLVFDPTPSDAAVDLARAEAEAIRARALEGEDFMELARRNSDDPGSQQLGGDLGWFRRGNMLPEFEDEAFTLDEGEIGDLVETVFGFHIIKVERRRGGEVNARHILIQPEVLREDIDRARILGFELRGRIEAGESIADLRETYGNLDAPDTMAAVPMDQLGELPPGFDTALENAEPGMLVGPLEYETQGQTHFAIIQVVEVREEGRYSYEDVEDQIRSRLREQILMEQIISDLREKAYIDIRM
ncbi:MAG: peptidylprolyl isomerase [Gemmatimonadetes bacterium]|nr:peptidylprolyl isomerase [Gemmatimonadota bacterium]